MRELNHKGSLHKRGPIKNKWPYILFKRLIVLKIIRMTGELNGVIRPFSIAALAKRQALSYCLTILSPFKFREHTATLGDAI